MSNENHSASSPVLSVDEEGYIELHVGEPDNLITQLGRKEDDYLPWKKKIIDDVYFFTSYVAEKGYVPKEFKSTHDFVSSLRDQATINPYIENYIDKGMSFLIQFLNEKGITDENTKYICLENNSELTGIIYEKVALITNNAYDDIIRLRSEIDADSLYIADNVPDDVRSNLEPILNQLQRVDAHYDFEDLDFSSDELKYISGFNEIDEETLSSKINTNDEIVIFSDVLSSGYTYIDAYNSLRSRGYKNIICFISLMKQL